MGFIRGIRNSIAFLTVFPIGMDKDGLSQAASYMPFFPLVGGLVGLLAGISVWLLDAILPPLISGMIGIGILLLITGAHHTDGLLDFGDALMLHGTRQEKIRILHDPRTGAGGLLLGTVILMITALSLGSLDRGIIIQSMVVSEATAKFVPVFLAAIGQSAFRGMNTPFVKAMHDKLRWARLASSLVLLLVMILPTLRIIGITVTFAAILTGAAMLAISSSQFGGVTGDVMGAANDLTRTISLLTILVTSKWL